MTVRSALAIDSSAMAEEISPSIAPLGVSVRITGGSSSTGLREFTCRRNALMVISTSSPICKTGSLEAS
jgi:hypothetical protein